MLQQIPVVARQLDHETLSSSPNRSTAISTYRRACATHESEYDEKYAYSPKIASAATNSSSCTSKQLSQTFACNG